MGSSSDLSRPFYGLDEDGKAIRVPDAIHGDSGVVFGLSRITPQVSLSMPTVISWVRQDSAKWSTTSPVLEVGCHLALGVRGVGLDPVSGYGAVVLGLQGGQGVGVPVGEVPEDLLDCSKQPVSPIHPPCLDGLVQDPPADGASERSRSGKGVREAVR